MNSQYLQEFGINIFDIRDFVDLNFVKEYKESVINARKWLDKESKHCKNDDRIIQKGFVKYFERLLGKDYSYLKKESGYQLDYKFISDCFNYFDENNIIELPYGGLDKESTPLTHLCVQAFSNLLSNPPKHVKLYYEMSNIINVKIIKLIFGEDNDILTSSGHVNVLPKNSYMAIHQDTMINPIVDGRHIRPLTIINYPNVNRTLEDGSLYRYFIPTEYNGKNAKLHNLDFFHMKKEILQFQVLYEDYTTKEFLKNGCNYYDILPDYKTVLVMNNEINDGVFGNIPHMVTKNNSENTRYSVYIQTHYKGFYD